MERAVVLLVEDNADIQEMMVLILESAGYEVAAANNGLEALEYLSSHQAPSVILLDLMMPVMTGWEFRDRQRRNPALRSIPVVVLSGSNRLDLEAQALDVEFCLSKPVDIHWLLEIVHQYCQLGARNYQAAVRPTLPAICSLTPLAAAR